MVDVIRIPKLGLSDYGELVSWEVDIGDTVSKEQVVAVLESEKASADIESTSDGVLLETYVETGEEVAIEVGKPLAVVGEEGESVPSLDELDETAEEDDAQSKPESETETAATQSDDGQSGASASDVKATPRAKRRAREVEVDLAAVDGTGPQGAITEDDIERHRSENGQDSGSTTERSDEEVKATPRAKRRATEDGVELANVKGSGPEGAVTEDDVEAYLESAAEGESEAEPASASSGDLTVTESHELSGIRKTIADRLSQSAREKPHVMGTREVSIEQLERVRDRLRTNHDVDVSLNDLLLHLVGRVLDDLPEFNAHFEDGTHKFIDEINVGYAVDGSRGLVVPVIPDVLERSLSELSEMRRSLVQRVIDDEFEPADLQGGTFTVTNVGVFEMDVSYSIINPPEVAILAIGRRKHAPVERNGEVDFEKVITFSLTIDHRALDGADSGAFLDQLAEYVEHPGVVLDAV
ncbi:2-oxo acid dehydrogenase subunit E2 [Halogeometricum sp. S1BR25-6]|uniref:2-oxo acid dehydrogenase subunit E2 n=1 Tax=Halogeometricum salsisoli TaxID=2950536 RepID=A0ABU2GJE1_9EURY|nr:2-oxo acid dehydrogenase subunit E2 [Halogeometricum sp. S1BR25-6]MDS0300188.1 2-oxo acid dehydrogenase subunit E2 [Halogeometricum sp. S1BR25-6]